jgi:DNA phosphorothioation-associated putative methyltransferase
MSIGKTVAQHTYFHVSLTDSLESELRDLVKTASQIAQSQHAVTFNVIKIAHDRNGVSLLDYPGFFDEAFPTLRRYWTVDLERLTFRHRTYEESLNPPILHRKEFLLPPDHPERKLYTELTAAAEQIGLFDDPNRIGFKQAWEALLVQRGYKVVGHDLVPVGNDETVSGECDQANDFTGVARHLTALTRYGFSAPLQTLARFGFLDGSKTVFDYGCGRGDDLRSLRENNIEAQGWDPHFAAEENKRTAHLVNLGFVINVIENLDERIEALRGAFALSEEMLVVSAMLTNQDAVRGTAYGDGVLTSRNTFQKYYSQGELRQFIAEVLHEEPLPVGPGIFYVFKDKDAEQRFMYGRLENRRNILRLSRLSRPEKAPRVDRAQAKYERHKEILENLWESCLALGRDPDRSEVADIVVVTESFGTLPAALRFIKSLKDNAKEILDRSHRSRVADLQVYFAQLQFEKRKPYRHLEARLQKDVKVFFGDYRTTVEAGRELLFQIANIQAIGEACHQAAEHGIGWLVDSESLQLHTSLVEQLPALLRTYIGCGTILYGDVSNADLIKIHIRSGKLTLIKYDDFANKPLPRMIQRVKLNLRQQDFDVFDYGDPYEPPYLYLKSRFINEEHPLYAEQVAFEEELESIGLSGFSGYGPAASEFDAMLEQRRYNVEGFKLVRSQTIPDLDAPCGRYLTYRQLIECGETQRLTGLPNLPEEPDSYTSLLELAINVLDPVIEYFGMIKLTYGFCSPPLAKQIPGRIAPVLDQHAAHEQKRSGTLVCSRLGAAADFLVQDENMREVADWIIANRPFDRLYFYGNYRPVHVSNGPEQKREAIEMVASKNNRLIPRPYRATNS